MKKFEAPELEVVTLVAEDIITSSNCPTNCINISNCPTNCINIDCPQHDCENALGWA